MLSDSGEAVAGLYAAGDVCGSIEEKDGRPYAMGFDAAMNYGCLLYTSLGRRIAGNEQVLVKGSGRLVEIVCHELLHLRSVRCRGCLLYTSRCV